MNFFEDVKKQIEQDKLFFIAYYGTSATSQENVFPNWGEIMRYVLKDFFEEKIGVGEKAYWNLHTVNMGLNGASSDDLLERFDEMVLDKKPNLIFLSVGKNDAYLGIDKKNTEENTRKIIQKALDKNIRVVFKTTVPSIREDLNKKVSEYVDADRSVAKEFSNENNFIFVDLFDLCPKDLIEKSYTLISPGGNKEIGYKRGEIDPIHYNKYGNAIVAKILLKEVFGIDFDEDKFLEDLNDSTKKYPDY